MLFSAAQATLPLLAPDDPIASPSPSPSSTVDDEAAVLGSAIWTWKHDATNPAVLTDIRVLSRGMGHAGHPGHTHHPLPVFDRIEFGPVRVRLASDGSSISLPIEQRFVVGKFAIDAGQITTDQTPLWRLDANIDASLLIALAYDLVDGQLRPVDPDTVERPDFFRQFVDRIDAGSVIIAGRAGPPRFIVAVSLTLGKERNDCEPGEILGGARIGPHVMVRATVDLLEIEATISQVRPSQTAKHGGAEGAEMQDTIGQILMTDRNRGSEVIPNFLPHWDNVFDYYHVNLPSDAAFRAREFKVVDSSAAARQITGAVERLSLGRYQATTIRKAARQGAFDNLHLAPRMKVSFRHKGANVDLVNIAMAPFCIHDCLHTHFRWGDALGQPGLGPGGIQIIDLEKCLR